MNQPPYNQPPWGPPGQPQQPGWGPAGPGPFGAPTGGGYGQPGYGGYGPQPPRKSNSGAIIAVVVGVVLLCVAALVGAGVWFAMRENDPAATSLLVSDDGKSEMKVPPSWSRRTGLNSVAVLQAGNPAAEEYIIVISESKVD